jgi:ferritin-like metal-binding protein YciE
LIAWLDDAYAMEIQLLPALCDRAVEAYSVAKARSKHP